MNTATAYAVMYLEINLVSVILVAMIGHKTNGLSKMIAQRSFSRAINSLILFFLSDTCYVMMKYGLLPYSGRAVIASKSVYFFSTALMCYFWFIYFEHLQGTEFANERKKAVGSSVLVWVMFLLLIVNLFTGVLFYVDDDGVYRRGGLFLIQYLLAYLYVFAAAFHAFIGIWDKSKLNKRKTLIYLALFPVFPAGAGILQFIYPELPLACAALSIATLIMYLNRTDEMISADPLTKLNNRKQLSFYYEQWQQQERREPMYVMMIDANDFKAINDTYGHISGDDALIRISNALILTCREYKERTNIARYGGDEFIVLLLTDSEDRAAEIKQRINENLRRLNDAAKAPYELTVSVGYVPADRSRDLGKIIEAADEMLYEEKARFKRSRLASHK